MRNIILLLPLLLFSSCATLLLRKDYDLRVAANVPDVRAEILDSIYQLPAEIKIRRSPHDLKVKLMSERLQKEYLVKASPNKTFLYGNLLWMQLAPAAWLVDFTNPKRFYYGNHLFFSTYDTTSIIRPEVSRAYHAYWSRTFPSPRGTLNFTWSFPWVNSFYLQPHGETPRTNTGFWGLSAGVEYFYSDNKYLALNTSAVMDFFLPVPAAVDFSGEVENMNSLYVSLTDNIKFRRFTLGYGLNYSANTWSLVYHDRFDPPPPTRPPATRTGTTIGLTLDGYHQVAENFLVGIIYRPSILQITPKTSFRYEHLISLDFRFRIRMRTFFID